MCLYTTCMFIYHMYVYITHVCLYNTCTFIYCMYVYTPLVCLYTTCMFTYHMHVYMPHVCSYTTCTFIYHMYVYIPHVCLVPWETRRCHWIPWNWNYIQIVASPHWVLGTEPAFSPRAAGALNL